jgi:hypothetical protein
MLLYPWTLTVIKLLDKSDLICSIAPDGKAKTELKKLVIVTVQGGS